MTISSARDITRKIGLLFSLFLIGWLIAIPANAALTGNEALSLSQGTVVSESTPSYDPTDETIPVTAFAFLDGGDRNDFLVFIQNRAATYGGYDAANDLHYWRGRLSLGPNHPPPGGGGWPVDYPFLEHYVSDNRRFRPVVAELYTLAPATGSGFVDRAMDTIIDGRAHGFGYNAGGAVATRSIGMQLTPSGLQALGESHGQSTPTIRSTIDDYLSHLASLSIPVSADASPRLCIRLTDAPEEFQQTKAFAEAVDEAKFQYDTLYVPSKEACDKNPQATNPACIALQSMCVRKKNYDNPDHYRVCVDTLSATLSEHTVEDVQNIEIEYAGLAQPGIRSQVTLTGEEALFDLDFEDVEIQWRLAPGACLLLPPLRPAKPLSPADMDSFEVLEDWRTCDNLELNIDKTCTDCAPIDYPASGADSYITLLEPDTTDLEKQNATDSGAGSLGFSGIGYTTDIEACGETYWKNDLGFSTNIRDQIIPLMDDTLDVLHSDINHAWIGDNQDFEYTETIDDLLQPLETGTTTIEPDDIALEQPFNSCNEVSNAGLACDYHSRLSDANSADVTGWFSSPTGDSSGRPTFSPNATVPGTNAGFDASALITTNLLNQHVEARFRDKLTFSYIPTYEQLSLIPPGAKLATDRVTPLTANDLVNLAQGFTHYGNDSVSINVMPTDLKPFVWMQPDNTPSTTTLTAQLPQLQFTIRIENATVMRGYFSLVDERMTTSLHPSLTQVVDISIDEYHVTALAYESTLHDCFLQGITVASSCDQGVATQLAQMVMPEVVRRFDSFFDGVVAPQAFHQQSDIAETVVLTQLANFNQNNTVGLYGIFEKGCGAPSHPLSRNQWQMISIPCQPPADQNRATDVFGDDIEGAYGTTWRMFEYDANAGYTMLGQNSEVQAGKGYWIVNNSSSEAMLDMPSGSTAAATIATPGCVTREGCFSQALGTKANGFAWTMAGNPFDREIQLARARVTSNLASQCSAPMLCDLNTANTLSLVSNQAFHYDGSSYNQLTQDDSMQVWNAAWWGAYPDPGGSAPTLLLPTQ